MASSQSQTETYNYTKDTTRVTVTPRTMTQSEQIARYFTEDLTHFIKLAHINLIEELKIPAEYANDTDEIIEMLYDDLAHMLREGLITGINLLLSEPKRDPNSGAYPLRYHAMYVVQQPSRTQRTLQSNAQRFGGMLAPPNKVWENARFAMLIDWNPSANERRRQVRRPEYCFDWVPEQSRFDASTLIRFREGGMAFNGATVVVRTESQSPGF